MSATKPLICITTGEPAGIGPEICLDLATCEFNHHYNLVLLGDIQLLAARAQLTAKKVKLNPVSLSQLPQLQPAPANSLNVLHIPCPNHNCLGKPQPQNSAYVLQILDQAIQICQLQLSNVIVTAPLNKDVINAAGIPFSGHTEYFAEKFGCSKVVMMLSNPQLNVALLTTHLPLKAVAAQVSNSNLEQTLTIIHHAFKHNFGIPQPRIGVCGLNPHAGENGYLGDEELNIINPVIQRWQAAGFLVSGSYPADTIYNQAQNFDVILAMYHDQGLPVVKYSDFEHGVNVTLGLPIIRTSVDHGTAVALAGTGRASSKSLVAAISFATQRYAPFASAPNVFAT